MAEESWCVVSWARDVSRRKTCGLWWHKGDRKERKKKGVSTESLNILSVYVKTCVICVWKTLVRLPRGIVGARPVPSRKLGSQDAWVGVSVCVWASGLVICVAHLSLSLSYVNIPKPSKATWTTKRRLRIDQDTHTQIHFLNQCVWAGRQQHLQLFSGADISVACLCMCVCFWVMFNQALCQWDGSFSTNTMLTVQ